MNNSEKLNYYELLEVPVDASFFEIRHAYRDALSIYDEDSLSTYSLFPDEERAGLLKRIEDAFNVLIDETKRFEYDEQLVKSGKLKPSERLTRYQDKSIPIFRTGSSAEKNIFFKKVQEKVKESDIKSLAEEIIAKALISGQDLKKLRKAIGIELEEIFEVARISISMLKAIENNKFHDLPSLVYLKNFLKSYAEILHLDSEKVVDGYIINLTLMQK
ncbi:MAG: helix-turn-helix domain-containing protein [Deltaproteobacteria bacterium]|nr:helix-turn-helix domain-containing protein [Deltaproteobacteria bacterium]